jgi:hypothetical protein
MEKKEDLFDLKLDQEGRSNLSKVFRLTKLSFWASILVELFILFHALRNYLLNRDFGVSDDENRIYYWELRIYTGYIIIFSSLVILQGYYFLKFARQAKQSVELNDTYSFNRSFAWVRKSLVIGIILIFFNALYFLQLFYWEAQR